MSLIQSLESRRLMSVSLQPTVTQPATSFTTDDMQFNFESATGGHGGVVVWQAFDGNDSDIVAQRIGNDGQPNGSPISVIATMAEQSEPEAAVSATGEFVVGWREINGSVFIQKFDANGSPVGSAQHSTTPSAYVRVAIAADGSFALMAQEAGNVTVYRFNPDATANGSTVVSRPGITSYPGGIAMSATGGVVATWTEAAVPSSSTIDQVYIAAFDSSLQLVTPPTLLSDPNAYSASVYSEIAVTGENEVTIAWVESSLNPYQTHLQVQSFDFEAGAYESPVTIPTDGNISTQIKITSRPDSTTAITYMGAQNESFLVLRGSDRTLTTPIALPIDSPYEPAGAVIADSGEISVITSDYQTHFVQQTRIRPTYYIAGTVGDDQVSVTDTGSSFAFDINGTQTILPAFDYPLAITTGDGNDTVDLRALSADAFPSIAVDAGNGNDRFMGSEIAEEIDLGDGRDYAYGNGGNDSLVGGTGVDHLWGGEGNDRIKAGGGNDFAYGGNGADNLYGDAGNDYLAGESGTGRIWGGDGNDTLIGHIRSDVLFGDAGDDLLLGGKSNDLLNGGLGNDRGDFSDEDASVAMEVLI